MSAETGRPAPPPGAPISRKELQDIVCKWVGDTAYLKREHLIDDLWSLISHGNPELSKLQARTHPYSLSAPTDRNA